MGNLLQTIGALFRWLFSYWPEHGMLGMLFGQFLAGTGQVFIVGSTVKVAAVWFGPKERIMATSIGYLLNTIGIGVAYFVPFAVKEGHQIPWFMLLCTLLSGVGATAFLVGFRSSPPTPPSISASLPRESYSKSVGILLREKYYVLIWFALGILMGAYFSFMALIEQIGSASGYSSVETGAFGLLSFLGGVAGDVASGVVDRYQDRYVHILCSSYAASGLSQLAFSASISLHGIPWVVAVASFLYGFLINFTGQVSIQAAVELSYPVPEGISSFTNTASLQFFGVIFIALMSTLGNPKTHAMRIPVWFCTASVCFICVAMLFYKGKHKRIEVDMQSTEMEGVDLLERQTEGDE